MEQTWTLNGMCGVWRLTATLEAPPDAAHPVHPGVARSGLSSLGPHFDTAVNLIEAQTLWNPADPARR